MGEVPLYVLSDGVSFPAAALYRGTSLIRSSSPPQSRHRALGIFLPLGPGGALFLMHEVGGGRTLLGAR